MGSVAQNRLEGAPPPFPRSDRFCDFCDGYAGRGVAVQGGDADLEFGKLAVEISPSTAGAVTLDNFAVTPTLIQLRPESAVEFGAGCADGAAGDLRSVSVARS